MIHDEFERRLRHARGCIARNDHVRTWSLYAIRLIARQVMNARSRARFAAHVREAELLLAGIMSSYVDPALFHAGGLVFHMKLLLSKDEQERAWLAARARGMLDAALAAGTPDAELLLDQALLELDASDSLLHRAQVDNLRRGLATSTRSIA
jgi:hypothetical protein